jgi:MFS family permease
VLRHGVYSQLLAGNFVLFMGIWLYLAAASWVMLELTGSAVMVGLVGAATFIPRVLLALPIGAIVDLFERRVIVIVGVAVLSVAAIATGVLSASDRLAPWPLVAMTIGLGTGHTLAMSAYQATIQDLVPRELVSTAVSLQSGCVSVARAVGPAIGGALVAMGRADIAFIVTGISSLIMCATATRIPAVRPVDQQREPMGHAMRVGLRFVRHSPELLRAITAATLFALTSANVQAVLAPAAAARGLGAQGYGLLLSGFGLGALAGAIVTDRVTRATGAHVYAVVAVVFGVTGIGFAYVPGIWAAALLAVVAGGAWVIAFASFNTLVQLTTPAWVRGRVLSLYMMGVTWAIPVGSVIAGALVAPLGVANAIGVMCASVIAAAGVTWWLRLPAAHAIAPPDPAEPLPDIDHVDQAQGGPVAVLVTWNVPEQHRAEFLTIMTDVRRVRLRSGAARWRICYDPDQPSQLTELFEVPDWDEHLRQRTRLDGEAVAVLRRARELDQSGQPQVRHLVGLPVCRPISL